MPKRLDQIIDDMNDGIYYDEFDDPNHALEGCDYVYDCNDGSELPIKTFNQLIAEKFGEMGYEE